MIRLGHADQGRDNNFNLIRFVAASAVLVSHAWPISLGSGAPEPLDDLFGMSLGKVAVFVFFAISGYLVAVSFDRSRSKMDFILARGLRLFPGLVVSVVLVTLVMGSLVSSLTAADYLGRSGPWTAILRNVTLAFPQYTLPGVFEANPYPAVQGSIWTLIHEVLCYVMLFVAGLTGALRRTPASPLIFAAFLAGWFGLGLVADQVPGRLMQLRELALPFFLGTTLWLWRDRILLSLPAAVVLLAAAVAARGTVAGLPLMALALTYGTFCLAHIPKGRIRAFNRLGDYSYGIYVYAFPLQGLAVWLFGPLTPAANIAIAFPATLFCAVLSWHLVEAPALRLRRGLRGARRGAPVARGNPVDGPQPGG